MGAESAKRRSRALGPKETHWTPSPEKPTLREAPLLLLSTPAGSPASSRAGVGATGRCWEAELKGVKRAFRCHRDKPV